MDRGKWTERRAARRGRAVPAPQVDRVPRPPRNLRIAFTLWLVVGVPACLLLWGIWVVTAAFHLRQGYRGSRILLTGMAAMTWLAPLSLLAADGGWWALVSLPVALVTLAAAVLSWTAEVTSYMEALRTR